MNRKIMKASALSALALTMVLWGCESLSENALVGPGERSDIRIVEKKDGYTVARETDPAVGVIWAEIDQIGGSLNIGNHVLTVPAGAVSAPTIFTMTKLQDKVEIGLTATRVLPNDIGHAGFAVPVRLSLSYANVADVPADVNDMKVMWLKPNGQLLVQPSVADPSGESVIGTLNHFSGYILGKPRVDE